MIQVCSYQCIGVAPPENNIAQWRIPLLTRDMNVILWIEGEFLYFPPRLLNLENKIFSMNFSEDFCSGFAVNLLIILEISYVVKNPVILVEKN